MCGRKTGRLLQQLDSNPTAMRSIVPLAHSQHSGGATEVVNWYELHPPRTKIWISWDQVLTTLPAANKREAASPACRINVCKLWAAGHLPAATKSLRSGNDRRKCIFHQ